MPDSGAWEGLAAAFSYPGTGPRGASWEASLPDALARRARELGQRRVEAEHVRLFVNALPEAPCPPYASWYRDGQLMGETASRLRRVYRRWGVDVRDEAPDHIAVQLAFIAALKTAVGESGAATARAAGEENAVASAPRASAEQPGHPVGAAPGPTEPGRAVEASEGAQAEAELEALLTELREWTPRFFSAVREHDRTGFYAAAAERCGQALADSVTR